MAGKKKLLYVQGIRGFAILLVVLFHLLPQVCPSGYMGVDVFFVLSGYFLIGRQLENGADFKLPEFLKKKALRLLIPYFALLTAVSAVSLILLPAAELVNGEKLLKACLWLKGNLFLDKLSGNYFSTDTRTFPLMHLWYMAVLMQCYLVFTLLFLMWHYGRCSRKARLLHLALLGGASFAVAYLRLTPIPWEYAASTYYWTSARIWEFVLGGILFILPKPRSSATVVATAVGALLVLTVCSFFPMQESALMVLLGAVCGCLLLRCGALWEKFSPLRCSLFVWLGGISFSLYLVHWPCISFAEFILGQPLTCSTALLTLLLILPLSILFYRGVEKPTHPLWVLPVMMLIALMLQKGIHKTDGFRDYLHREINQTLQLDYNPNTYIPRLPESSRLYAGTEGIVPNNFTAEPDPDAVLLQEIGDSRQKTTFVVLGDSHACDVAAGLHSSASANGWHGVFLNSYITPFWNAELPADPLIAIGNFYNEDKAQRLMRWLAQHRELQTVFIAQYWQHRLVPHPTWSGKQAEGDMVQVRAAELREFCRRLRSLGKKVVIFTDNPVIATDAPERVLGAYLMFPLNGDFPPALTCDKASYEQENAAFNRELDRLAEEGLCRVFHRERAFFRGDTFRAFDGKNLLLRDAHHLTLPGAEMSIAPFQREIDDMLRSTSAED